MNKLTTNLFFVLLSFIFLIALISPEKDYEIKISSINSNLFDGINSFQTPVLKSNEEIKNINITYGEGNSAIDIYSAYKNKYKIDDQKKEIFIKKPVLNDKNFFAGQISDSFIKNGLNTLNLCRFIAGLPDVSLSETFLDNAQHSSYLIAINKTFGHNQKKPPNMDEKLFKKSHENGTQKSNLSYTWSNTSFPNNIVVSRIIGLFFDPGKNNLESLGHRRWQLNPLMGKTGIGYVEYKKEDLNYAVLSLYAVDDSSKVVGDNYNFISWPSPNAFPTQLANFSNYSLPWSITLNPNKYDNTKTSDISVTVKNLKTNEIWKSTPSKKYELSEHEEYFNVDTSLIGVPFNISFRPMFSKKTKFNDGDIYQVEVSGLVLKNSDKKASIKYSTYFFDINKKPDDSGPNYFNNKTSSNIATKNNTIKINFNEDIILDSNQNISLLNSRDYSRVNILLSVKDNHLEIKPNEKINPADLYYLIIPKESIRDLTGNMLEKNFVEFIKF